MYPANKHAQEPTVCRALSPLLKGVPWTLPPVLLSALFVPSTYSPPFPAEHLSAPAHFPGQGQACPRVFPAGKLQLISFGRHS